MATFNALQIRNDFYKVKIRKIIKNRQLFLIPDYVPDWSDIYTFNRVDSIVMESASNDSPSQALVSYLTYEDYMKKRSSRRCSIYLEANGLVSHDYNNGQNISIPLTIDGKKHLAVHTFDHLVICDRTTNETDLDALIINADGTTIKLSELSGKETYEIKENITNSLGHFREVFKE